MALREVTRLRATERRLRHDRQGMLRCSATKEDDAVPWMLPLARRYGINLY
jgi:hypothetical protein